MPVFRIRRHLPSEEPLVQAEILAPSRSSHRSFRTTAALCYSVMTVVALCRATVVQLEKLEPLEARIVFH